MPNRSPEYAAGTPFLLVGLGEVLWDMLPQGRQLGGAPANFACHARALGADAHLVSRVGNDDLGREARQALGRVGLPDDTLQLDSERPTGTVGVQLGADGQPIFTIHEQAAWDALAVTPAARTIIAGADALCFGTLAQREEPSRSTVRALVASARPAAWRILDLNLRPPFVTPEVIEASLGLANALKVNDGELARLAELLHLSGDERAQLAQLAARYHLRCVALTRGSRGSLLFEPGAWSEHAGLPAEVADTVGAGDSFTAALALGLLAGWPLDLINQRANQLAAFVCSRPGATPPLPAEMREPFQGIRHPVQPRPSGVVLPQKFTTA